jgi:Fe-Mn family superoxide dismutase
MTNSNYSLPSLGYDFDALEPAYSAELLELHYKKHHKAYVEGANKTCELLAEAREEKEFDKLNQLQTDLAFNVSGHVLHSMFWRNMSPDGGGKPSDLLSLKIADSFGSHDALREQFLAAATSIQGSGWAAMSWEPLSETLIVQQIHDHQNNVISGALPILLLDMWEHAYYLQYQNEKKRWAKAYWDLINWADVGEKLWRIQDADVAADASGEKPGKRRSWA